MSHILSVYFAPTHGRQSDRDYIAALQPPVIRLFDDPNVQWIADAHALAPNAIIAPRTWVIDDNNGAAVRNLMADPVGTGRDHAQQYRGQLDRWIRQAQERGLRIPPADRIYFNSANEPNQGGTPDKINAYSIAFLDRCTELGLRAGAPCLGVGWPGNTGPDMPVDWSPYAGLEQAIRRGNHWLILHEYWYDSGPIDGWKWWAGRHLQCPFDVPILIGECGIDNFVDAERWSNEGGNRGWRGNVEPDAYAEQIEHFVRGSSTRVVAVLPFITDYRSNMWESFDTAAAHNALLAHKERMVPQNRPQVVVPPIRPEPPPTEPIPPIPAGNVVHPLPGARITQHFYQNPKNYARWELPGHNGTDFGAAEGTVVCACAAGVVAYTGDDQDYGLYVRLYHKQQGIHSFYAHLAEIDVSRGDRVTAGRAIGRVGSTGNSTGPHLHLEIRCANDDESYNALTPMPRGRIDPQTWFCLQGIQL